MVSSPKFILLQSDFTRSSADTSMFSLKSTGGMIILLLYEDDIRNGDNSCLLSFFVKPLCAQFALKDLGRLPYFWALMLIGILTLLL